MVDDRLSKVARRLRAAGDEFERARAEELRRAEEAAERKLRVERGWRMLQAKREEIIDEINSALSNSGFQLHMSSDGGAVKDDEVDHFRVTIRGRPHPKLGSTILRVSLKDSGAVVADVITEATSRRLKRLTFEEFTQAAWRELLLDHLETAGSDEPEQASITGAK